MEQLPLRRLKQFLATATLALAWPCAAMAQPGPAPVMFASDETGQSCLVRQRSPDGGHDVLGLERCGTPAARFVFDEQAMRIRPADSPDLCLGDTTGAGAAPFDAVLRPCDEGLGQSYAFDRRSRRLLSLTEENRFDSRPFCLYLGPDRRGRTPLLARPCSDRVAREGHVNFQMLPAR